MKNKFLTTIVLLLLGCASQQTVMPQALVKTTELNRQAEAAYSAGDLGSALALYKEALRINRSIENTEGIAIEIFNIATVYRKMGRPLEAEGILNEMLEQNSLYGFSDRRLSEAAFLKGIILLEAGDYSGAMHWADKSIAYCTKSKCPTGGKTYNLMARIALVQSDPEAAISYADKAYKLNLAQDKEEAANSLRLMAEAQSAMGNYAEAVKLYEEALSYDKALALSGKIALDLMGAGNSMLKMGRCTDANVYFRRAIQVLQSAGNDALREQAKRMITECK